MHKRITDALGIKNTGKYGFVNNYPSQDTELYLDSNLIKIAKKVGIKDFDASNAYNKILDFFKTAFSNYRRNKNNLDYLIVHELNDTHFGMSLDSSNSRGKGPSEDALMSFVDRVIEKNLDLNIFTSPNNFNILTPRIGPDYFSDLITNIIFKELYDFTKIKIKKLNVNNKLGKSSKKKYKYWDLNNHKWKFDCFDTFVIDNFDTILVPTQIVSKKPGYDVNYFVTDIIVQIQRDKELLIQQKTKKKARNKKQIEKEELSKYIKDKKKNLSLDKVSENPSLLDLYHPEKHFHRMNDDNDFKV